MDFFKVVVFVFLSVFVSEVTNYEAVTETTTEPAKDICSQCLVCAEGILDCSGSGKVDFSEDYWNAVTTLNPLHMNYSRSIITTLPTFPSLPVQTLDLSHCALEDIETGAFSNLGLLVTLDLSWNKLSSAALSLRVFLGPVRPGTKPEQLTKIRSLNMAGNDIHSLAQDIFVFMRELTVLDLSGNPLAFIDQVTMAAISELRNLKELKLSNCGLEAIPEGLLRRLMRLQVLDISNNKFTKIPSVLPESVGLLRLDFGQNLITVIPSVNPLSNLTKLQELNLSHSSKLATIEAGSLGSLKNLEVLYLNHNLRLTNLDPDCLASEDEFEGTQWPPLKELYLNNNNLSRIDSHIINRWDKLTNLDLTNNPYYCDCTIQWMVHTLVHILNNTANRGSEYFIVCKNPPDMKGLTFKYLFDTKQSLVCPKENLVEATDAEGVILFGFMIGVFVSFPVMALVVIIWRRGYFSRWRGRMINHRQFHEEIEDL